MAVNLNTDLTIRLDEPVTSSELRVAKANQEASQKANETVDNSKAVKLVSNFSKNKSLMRRRKSRKKKKELEKKRREQQAKEQAQRDRSSRKYTTEMRNRDVVRQKAVELQNEAQATSSVEDDKFVASKLFSKQGIDKLVYNTVTSDAENQINDIADCITDNID